MSDRAPMDIGHGITVTLRDCDCDGFEHDHSGPCGLTWQHTTPSGEPSLLGRIRLRVSRVDPRAARAAHGLTFASLYRVRPARLHPRREVGAGMKVLLFVQNEGDKRPKCVKQFGADKARALQYLGHLVRPESGLWLYWLVECESAEAGRRLIEWHVALGPDLRTTARSGRILASGGKR